MNREPPSAVVYPPAPGEPLSGAYRLRIGGNEVPVYTARVDALYRESPLDLEDTYSFAGFDLSRPVEVVLESSVPLTELSIRAVGRKVPARLDGKEAVFTIDGPGNFLIERNGNGRKDLLLLFASPLESDAPGPDDPGVVYYGPGKHNAGLITLGSNQTLYLHGGAVVTGRVEARGENIRICGRGVLEQSGDDYYGQYMILLEGCRNALVEGIVLRKNSRGWTLVARECDGVLVDHVRICGTFFGNDDGIDPVNTRDMTIRNCFIRTKDDCLAFKGMDDELSNCENITVHDTMMWTDQCCTILLGDESRAAFMRNITIRDCFVPYLSYEGYPKKFLMLHAGEEMVIEDIRIENIDIGGDGQDRNYIEMTCEFNRYCKSQTAGHIRNVRLKNVHLSGRDGGYFIMMKGHDAAHRVEQVTFEHCTINGRPLDAGYPGLEAGPFVKNIDFLPGQGS